MKALLIGGTGTISMAITRLLAENPEWEVYLLNRGTRRAELPQGVRSITADIRDEEAVRRALDGRAFDCVCDFIAYTPEEVERDYRLFSGRTKQYIFISSASAYKKPVDDCVITESTPLCNPYWQYSRDKIACEDLLMRLYRSEGFPATIVRPSHTYDERKVPVSVRGDKGAWQVMKRMMDGKPVLVHGDGTSLWTLTFNTDFARAFMGLMGNPRAIGEAYHITSDESVTWNQIYAVIADELGAAYRPYYVSSDFLHAAGKYEFEGTLTGDKANSVIFDNSKIKRAVPGFCCVVRADQGLRRAVRHMLSHPQLQVEDPEFDSWCDRVIAALEAAKETVLRG
ncbi:MAG: SDR family oxidoreductase [Clostridia bacterium]|nr:SDR family oxidoreductase [Clostridia bacterium]MBQ7053276.1 SDR family oxidoreductase [Clostridia bacterium]